jgi:hypothetical protein
MPFLANEDQALKQKLSGLFVHDATSGTQQGRPVVVRFKNPEYELSQSQYPLIMLSHTSISKADERESRGYVRIGYAPEGYAGWADMTDPGQSPYFSQTPIPVNVDYRIDVFARKQTHLIDLTAQLMSFAFLPDRLGFLVIPQDGTTRRLDVLGGPEYIESKDELGKRLFTAVWSIRISSEIFLATIDQLTPAQKTIINLVDLEQFQDGYLTPLDPPLTVTRPKLVPATTTLPAGHVGVPYQQSLSATGGIAPYQWVLQNGALPAGLYLAPEGVIFGTPTVPTTAQTFTVACTDSAVYGPQTAPQLLTLTIGS